MATKAWIAAGRLRRVAIVPQLSVGRPSQAVLTNAGTAYEAVLREQRDGLEGRPTGAT